MNQWEESGTNFSVWSCSRCGTSNAPVDRFCKRCGAPAASPAAKSFEPNSGQASKKIILASLILLSVCSIVLIVYFGLQYRNNKVAVAYIESEGKRFDSSVNLINDLSTEKDFENRGDDQDVFLKKIENERAKSEKALRSLEEMKTENEKEKAVKSVSGVDFLFKQYFKEATEQVRVYDSYIGYKSDIVKESVTFQKELDKLKAQYKNIATPEEAVVAFGAQKKLYSDMAGRMDGIIPPAGLEEAHEKEVGVIKRISSAFGEMSEAIETKDKVKFIESLSEIEDVAGDEKTFKSIRDLQEFFFERLHNKFIDLRKGADNIRLELTKMGAEFGLEMIGNVNIEGW